MALLMSFGPDVWGQPTGPGPSDEICFSLGDSQKILKGIKENDLLKEMVSLLEEKVKLLEMEKGLLEKESQLKDKLIELAEKKAEMEHNAFLREKEVTDRALKLAEVAKPPAFGNWQLLGLAGFIGILLGGVLAN